MLTIYIAVGYTDMRKQIDGLAAVVQQNFRLDPFSNSLFLFCGRWIVNTFLDNFYENSLYSTGVL